MALCRFFAANPVKTSFQRYAELQNVVCVPLFSVRGMPLNVLHLVGGSINAGAALGAYWLHDALRSAGVHSTILTNSSPVLSDQDIAYITRSPKEKLISLIRTQLDKAPVWLYRNAITSEFSTGITGFDFTRTPEFRQADLIHLHWINSGLVNMKHLARVDKPIVWTLRDMWPMTGGCHYAVDCENYKASCGHCWQLGKSGAHDLSRWVLKRKIRYVPRKTVIVGISQWLAQQARGSAIFRNFDVRVIPNNINLDHFFPVDKQTARGLLGLSTKKKIVLAGAQDLRSRFKGFDKFLAAVDTLPRDRYLLVFFGRLDERPVKQLGFEFKSQGLLHDSISLRLLYSAADVFVAPSTIEAFGKTIAEAMACGTPAVSFDSAGPRDIIDHQKNGYLAQPFDPGDLANGISFVANSDTPSLSENARKKVAATFDSRIIAGKYKELYEELVGA
jgi:glycosyltransferase involved in cell wall biosynthesis